MDETTIGMDKLHFWHSNPCDNDPNIPGGICKLLGVESVQHKKIVEIFNKLKNCAITLEDNPRIKYYKNLGETGIYSARDDYNNPIVIKKISGNFYLSEGYHRVLALLLLNIGQLRLDLVKVEVYR